MATIKNKFSNDDFAIWFSGSKNFLNLNFKNFFYFDVHINEWLNPKNENYIDLGIRIYNTHKISSCNIFVPFLITSNELVDLYDKFQDENIARGIFNANCILDKEHVNSIIEIQYNDRNENIIKLSCLYPCVTSIGNGSLINLNFDNIKCKLTSSETYIRFRLPHKTIDNLFNSKKHNYKRAIESPIITDIYSYVININEVRSLSPYIRNIFPKSSQKINKVILTSSINSEYNIDDATCYRIRYLEGDLYSNYVPDTFSCDNVITYQWLSEKSMKNHYTFNFKVSFTRVLWATIAIYCFFVIAFSFLGDFLWQLLKIILRCIQLA